MVRTITIGDIHGRDTWKRVDPEKYDRIIFLGDYVDSYSVEDGPMLANLRDIIRFKKIHPQKVILLVGNHEASYLFQSYRSTGYRESIAREVVFLLETNKHLFQSAWQAGKSLWTHAGLTQGFYEKNIRPMILEEDKALATTLYRLYNNNYPPIFEIGRERGGSRGNIGGPLWLDRTALLRDPLLGYHQVVGHTPVPSLYYHEPIKGDTSTSVTFCDCLEDGGNPFFECDIA